MNDFIGYIAPPGWAIEPPVHDKTIVDVFWSDGETTEQCPAEYLVWSAEGDGPHIVAYRVVEEYVEPKKPRERWINVYPDGNEYIHSSRHKADATTSLTLKRKECIHMIEVLK